MRPGTIIDIYFPFKPPAPGGKYRPAVIIKVDGVHLIAIAIKITKSGPTPHFPFRLRINHWRFANLSSPSYAERLVPGT